jgi:dCMP deaminase
MATTNKAAIVAYVPVVHAGYLELFKKYPQADLIIIDKQLLNEKFRSIQKDIRALETVQIVNSLQTLFPARTVIHLQDKLKIKELAEYEELIMSEDEISDWLKEEFFTDQQVRQDSIFLRWSKAKTKQEKDITPDGQITTDELHQQLMGQVVKQSQRSLDWWRQTAAAVAKDQQLISIAHNKHLPSDQNQYVLGDPRANFSRGEAFEVSTSLHAEEAVIAKAAAQGIALEGADLYVTTFPCPFCARLIAYSGVKRLFYKEGYSTLDGADLMKAQGVELIEVQD